MRRLLLVTLVVAAAAVMAVTARRSAAPDVERLAWIATAHQFGPVGYRDPAGAISTDGRWFAYSEGRFLRVRPIDGGPVATLPPNEVQIRNVAWSPDSRTILADGFGTAGGWAVYDRVAGTRRALWADHTELTAR